MPDCDRVCQGVPGSVSGIPQIQIVLNQQVNVLCQAMTGNFITTRVRERRSTFVELTMACVMTLPDTPIGSKAVGQDENVPSHSQSSKNDDEGGG